MSASHPHNFSTMTSHPSISTSSSSSSSPPSPTFPTTAPPSSSSPPPPPLFLLLKTPSPSPPHDKYTLALSPPSSGALPPSPPPLYIPVLTHTLRPDPLITLLLTHLTASSSSSSPPAATTPFPYGALILTSQRAAAALNAALSSPPVRSQLLGNRRGGAAGLGLGWKGVTIYTVGPATEAAVRGVLVEQGLDGGGDGGVEVKGGERAGSGEVLARGMLGDGEGGLRYEEVVFDDEEEEEGGGGDYESEPTMAGKTRRSRRRKKKKPVLFLAGETRRDVIPRMLQSPDLPSEDRIEVVEMTVYESTELESFAFEYAGALAQTDALEGGGGGGPRWTVVFSPMAGRGMLTGLGWLDEETMKVDGRRMEGRRDYVCCIGPTTRAYLSREFGLEADVVAEKPSPEGVREGIGRFVEGLGK